MRSFAIFAAAAVAAMTFVVSPPRAAADVCTSYGTHGGCESYGPSNCDLVRLFGPQIVDAANPLRNGTNQADVDRLNDDYGKLLPHFDRIARPLIYVPWPGIPDLRPDAQGVVDSMNDLQDTANNHGPTGAKVQAVTNAVGELQHDCVGVI